FSTRPHQSVGPISHGTTPGPGLIPNSPHAAAGMRTEPSPSLPWATGTILAATAAALPPDEPPALRSSAHGLRAIPVAPSLVPHTPNSGMRVIPTTTAPASRSRATTG